MEIFLYYKKQGGGLKLSRPVFSKSKKKFFSLRVDHSNSIFFDNITFLEVIFHAESENEV